MLMREALAPGGWVKVTFPMTPVCVGREAGREMVFG